MPAEKNDTPWTEDFALGTPALVCRWRLADRTLPLENRHLRALSRRVVDDAPVSPQLVAWAKQHIEWTLGSGASRYPDGVLMVIVDDAGRAAMTVGPYEPLSVTTVSALAERALRSAVEALGTGVAPESLWVVRGDRLVCGTSGDLPSSGAASLVRDLARTLGVSVSNEEALARSVMDGAADFDEAFLVSDEHGVIPASDAPGPRSRRLADGYARLLDAARHRDEGADGIARV